MLSPLCRATLAGLALSLLAGCASLAEKAGNRFAANLSAAMLEHDDPAMVEAATPSYLLLLDALVRQNPDSAAFRQAAANLNAAYAGAFVKDPPARRRPHRQGPGLCHRSGLPGA